MFLTSNVKYKFYQCKCLRTSFSHLSGRHLKAFGLQMNVSGASVSGARSSQACSDRGKKGGTKDLND